MEAKCSYINRRRAQQFKWKGPKWPPEVVQGGPTFCWLRVTTGRHDFENIQSNVSQFNEDVRRPCERFHLGWKFINKNSYKRKFLNRRNVFRYRNPSSIQFVRLQNKLGLQVRVRENQCSRYLQLLVRWQAWKDVKIFRGPRTWWSGANRVALRQSAATTVQGQISVKISDYIGVLWKQEKYIRWSAG